MKNKVLRALLLSLGLLLLAFAVVLMGGSPADGAVVSSSPVYSQSVDAAAQLETISDSAVPLAAPVVPETLVLTQVIEPEAAPAEQPVAPLPAQQEPVSEEPAAQEPVKEEPAKEATLIEATSGNTGIALAMVAAMRGYKMQLIMPDNMSQERKDAMRVYGAELIEVTKEQGMEGARDLALQLQADRKGIVLDQFANPDNLEAHYLTTGPELWQQTHGKITHFVSSMGTTGTIMGVSKYLKEQNPDIQIVGLQPAEGSSIPGIRRWPQEYLPKIFDASRVDVIMDVEQSDAEATMRAFATQEGIAAGVSSGGAAWAALQIAKEHPDAVIVCIICDRADRYLSTGVFS